MSWKSWSIGRLDGRCGRSPRVWGWIATRSASTSAPAREAGFGPGTGPPSEGWAAFVARVCPELGTARRNGAAWDELAARHDEIAERLKVNRPSTVWQRMHDEAGLQASLPSFRRYALAAFPEAYGRARASPCAATIRRQARRRRSITDGWASGPTRRPARR